MNDRKKGHKDKIQTKKKRFAPGCFASELLLLHHLSQLGPIALWI